MRNVLTSVLEIAGLMLVSIGVGMVSVPAGLVVAGLCMVLVGYMAGEAG